MELGRNALRGSASSEAAAALVAMLVRAAVAIKTLRSGELRSAAVLPSPPPAAISSEPVIRLVIVAALNCPGRSDVHK